MIVDAAELLELDKSKQEQSLKTLPSIYLSGNLYITYGTHSRDELLVLGNLDRQ